MNRFIQYLFILAACFALFMPCDAAAADRSQFVVVLDAGHGGGDTGTSRRKLKKDEKVIALDVVKRVGKLIEDKYPDVKVVYTRKKDTYPSLPQRTRIAKEAQGDLLVSIHVNAAPTSAARGVETYIFGVTGLKGKSADEQKRIRERMENEIENLDISGRYVDFDRDMDLETKILCQAQREKNNIHSEEVAKYVHNSIISGLKRTSYKNSVIDRGVKEKNIFVLCYSPMPAILVELGYMSNPAEERFLNTEEAMVAYSKAIFSGIEKYKAAWAKRKLGDNAPDETPEAEEETERQETAAKPAAKPEAKPAAKPEAKTSDVFYRIQFLSSDRLLKKGDRDLKGLWPISHYRDGKIYRYTYGEAKSSRELNAELKRIKKLFSDAFIIKTDADGNRIR